MNISGDSKSGFDDMYKDKSPNRSEYSFGGGGQYDSGYGGGNRGYHRDDRDHYHSHHSHHHGHSHRRDYDRGDSYKKDHHRSSHHDRDYDRHRSSRRYESRGFSDHPESSGYGDSRKS
eukprot:CAMPEP_0114576858 /NCGR_PEP_ID=MMETSP0125-20121206/1576_1 /TAXON_ID=485358 ORGANISM="Aristerostoma sp., Strain ATCC 50986" /NCGR_SAMPLE_ID=MMETSP0125 /ASSEMBLY_ACC=CAM_ASM_000245 /LENGTH=117 /DNA_ID=CAMNT_0001765705 /DNA_START=405 /DNA_END=755 /DNA_ORIENTATION=-